MAALALFETPAGFALFKVKSQDAFSVLDNIHKEFATPEAAAKVVKLKAFKKFADTNSALTAAAAICEGKLDSGLSEFLKTNIVDKSLKGTLAVTDSKLGGLIRESLGIKCKNDDTIRELMRGIRTQLDSLLGGISASDRKAMQLGLAHSLCRHKLQFSPDKVDVMIVQAIALLDELDKELNTYAMRVREWYGWHFPEMGKIVTDNIMYAKCVKKMGVRSQAKNIDFSEILPEDVEETLKAGAETSMGTEIAESDVQNITRLCDQVIDITQYRSNLSEYLRNRMQAIAPNLTCMVGELVGARLIAHAGSLMNLAKQPASTVQIVGADKALFRALKTKHDTPKYGLIYHASLVGKAQPKNKGKISRVLAAKCALSTRSDAFGEGTGITVALGHRAKVEQRLEIMEHGSARSLSNTAASKPAQQAYTKPTEVKAYNTSADVVMEETSAKKKKKKKDKSKEAAPADAAEPKKKKKRKAEESVAAPAPKKAKKSKKSKA
jgi:nucleolar protein 58